MQRLTGPDQLSDDWSFFTIKRIPEVSLFLCHFQNESDRQFSEKPISFSCLRGQDFISALRPSLNDVSGLILCMMYCIQHNAA